MRLGVLVRGEESLASDGLNKRAFWSSSRRMLAVVVRPLARASMLSQRLSRCCCQVGARHSTCVCWIRWQRALQRP